MGFMFAIALLAMSGVAFSCYPCTPDPDAKPLELHSHVNCGWVYHVSLTKKLTWQEAQSQCRQFGWELASIDYVEEFEYLRWLIAEAGVPTSENFWTSGNDIDEEGSFVWSSNGKPLEPFYPAGNYQPDDAGRNEDCVSLRRIFPSNDVGNYVMNDEVCDLKFLFICKGKRVLKLV